MGATLDDREANITAHSQVCHYCEHYLGPDKVVETKKVPATKTFRRCKAFEEIPMDIWEGKNKHVKPYPGDNGAQFKPKKL